MARYSAGKKAHLIEDRYGRKIRYKDARTDNSWKPDTLCERENKGKQMDAKATFKCSVYSR